MSQFKLWDWVMVDGDAIGRVCMQTIAGLAYVRTKDSLQWYVEDRLQLAPTGCDSLDWQPPKKRRPLTRDELYAALGKEVAGKPGTVNAGRCAFIAGLSHDAYVKLSTFDLHINSQTLMRLFTWQDGSEISVEE